jgi:hypothetical protein
VLADSSGGWLKLRDRHGRCKAVGIPSSQPGRFYVVTREHCDCQDWRPHQRRPCKHMQALAIAIARRQAELPASVVVDGLEQMARDRGADIFNRFEGD